MTIIDKLRGRFEWLEREDLRVGVLYLNPKEIAELETEPQNFDRQGTREIRATGQRGFLWGAVVYESALVPEGHVCIVQDGLEAKLVDGAACVVLR